MTRKRLYSILLIALGSILFVFFLQIRNQTRKQIEQFEDPSAVKAMKTVLQNYEELKKQLLAKNKLDTPYKDRPLSEVIGTTQQELKDMIDQYLDYKVTYAECKQTLKQMIKDFNEIIRVNNVDLLNLNIETLMPELPIEKASIQSPVYRTRDEYTASSDQPS